MIGACGASMTVGATGAKMAPLTELFELERAKLANAVRVYYPSEAMADKASISYHGQLLESHRDQGYMILELSGEDKRNLEGFGFKIAPAPAYVKRRNKQIDGYLQQLRSPVSSVQAADTIPNYPCYETVEGTYAKAAALAQAKPNLAQWLDIGDSFNKANSSDGLAVQNEGYDLRVLKITNSATTGEKPILFIHSAMHAREYATAGLTLRFAEHLVNGYGSDADVSWVLDNHEVHILFHMNPDGRKMAETGLLWRKNTNNQYCSNDSQGKGADLNRNFTLFWNSTPNGSSGNECSDTFRGPEPASEPETKAVEAYVRSLFEDKRGPSESDAAPLDTTGMHLDIHSYSELILWPWGHTSTPAPNEKELTTLGRKLASYNGYRPMQGVGLYPTDGTSDDVSYGELGIAAFTYELGTDFFQGCSVFENEIVPDNLKSLMYAAKVVSAPYILPAGPETTNVSLNGNLKVAAVDAGAVVTLKATVSDDQYSTRNGVEPIQTVTEARYFVGKAPWEAGAEAVAMHAEDGAFDSVTEGMTAQIDTEGMVDGKHIVYVQGKDADGNWGPASAVYLAIGQFNAAPIIHMASGCHGVKCDYSAAGSSDPDGSVVNYRWQFGDEVVEGSDEQAVTHIFADSGSYEVSLTITDDFGATSTMVSTETVTNLVPEAKFTSTCSTNRCTFNSSESQDPDGGIAGYSWDFGDGNSSTDANPAHTYSSAGTFTVGLTITDSSGATHAASGEVTVTMPTTPPPTSNTSSGGGGGSMGMFAGLALLLGLGRRRFNSGGSIR